MENLKGLELLHILIRDQLTCKEDCLVAVFHCLLINDGKKCVGTGDEWPETTTNAGSEMLPAGWNSNHEIYSLRYASDSSSCQYLLKIVKAGQSLLVNLLDANEEKTCNMSVNVSRHVSDNYKDFSNAYMNLAEVSQNFHNVVLKQMSQQKSASANIRTSGKTNPKQREKVQDPVYSPRIPESLRHDEHRFPSIGRGDLDPFSAGVGGGMLADPSSFRFPQRPGAPGFGMFGSPGIARGSVPPGARFDPVGPPGVGRGFSRPDPDHLPPPGYDDMFM